jgi:uncharacterized membrane protein YfcA
MLLPVGILAVIQYYKQGYVNFQMVFIIAAAFVIGGFLGSKIALNISDEKMKKVFGVILLLVSLKMLFFDSSAKKPTESTPTANTEILKNQ